MMFKKFDDYNHRSVHKTLATRTGGIGVFLTLLFISLFFYFNDQEIFDYSLFIPLAIMFVVGVYDDFYNADFKLKFLLQIIVAKILIDQGFIISNYNGFLGLYEIPRLLAQFTTIFVFLLIVNSINFIDGIDGLAITQVLKIIILIEVFSSQNTPLFELGFLVVFSLLPLYYYNFKKRKKIFLGDAGSLFLGTLIAIYILFVLGDQYNFRHDFSVNKTLFSIIVILYPLLDVLRVFILRIKSGMSPFEPDKRHLHHFILKKISSKHYFVTGLIIIIELSLIVVLIKLFET